MANIETSLPGNGINVHNELMGLNEGDYIHLTELEKIKFDGIQDGAEVNVNADWNSITGDSLILNKPTSFPPSSHTHPISDIINLQSTLDLKVDSVFGRNGSVIAANGDYTTALIPDTLNKRYVTDADLITISNQSGVNTGDETTVSIQTKRPLKTINSNSLEGIGNILLDSDSIPNQSVVIGTTTTDALNTLDTDIENIYNTRVKVEYPDIFTFRPFNIFEKNSRYYTDFKVSSLVSDKISKMLPYYVDFTSGNNANDGKTPTTAFKTISYAYGVGARLIYLSKGVHLSSWGDLNPTFTNTDDFFVIGATDGVSIVTNAPATFPTFSVVSGTAYSATVTSNTLAVDLKYTDSYGFPLKLKEVFTQAECISELGTFYKNLNVITINLKDGRVPDGNVLIPASTANANYSANAGYNYVKDITFIGGGLTSGSHGSDSQDGSNSTMVALSDNCKFLYAQSSNYTSNGGEGSRVRYNKLTMFENCVSYGNSRDGFNYVGDYANPMNIVEINCQAFNNGLRGASNSVNGSSSHQGAFPLRLNCKYYNNYGPNVADQGGGITYNVGVESFNSAVPSIDTANIDFNIQPLVGSTSYMFNRGCQAYGSVYSFRISGTTPAYMVNVGNHYGGLVSTNTPGAPQTITFASSFTTADVPTYVFPLLSAYTPLTDVIRGTGVSGQVSFWNSTNTQIGDSALTWNNATKKFGINTTPLSSLDVNIGASNNFSIASLTDGTIAFMNGSNSLNFPIIASKSSLTTGLMLASGTADINSSADMRFDVRETDGTDFSTLTSSAFRFTRMGVSLVDILRNGNTTFSGSVFAPTAAAGTNNTQVATTAFVLANARPNKVYNALISQTGTSAPTVTVLENTIGTIVWTRTTTGSYVGTLASAFTTNKTTCSNNYTSQGFTVFQQATVNTVTLVTSDITGTNLDGKLTNTSIKIEVYP